MERVRRGEGGGMGTGEGGGEEDGGEEGTGAEEEEAGGEAPEMMSEGGAVEAGAGGGAGRGGRRGGGRRGGNDRRRLIEIRPAKRGDRRGRWGGMEWGSSLIENNVLAADELVRGRGIEKVARTVRVYAKEGTELSLGSEFPTLTGPVCWIDKNMGDTPPDPKRANRGLAASPKLERGGTRAMRMRAEVREQSGMEESIAPKRVGSRSMGEKAASNFHESAIATLSNPILFWGVRKGGGLANAMRSTVRGERVMKEFATTI
ncbi:unnamed protein product [Closterium sp. Yama58-4]|nr:unnamed protein product [Closterium sp. Yama58-4]